VGTTIFSAEELLLQDGGSWFIQNVGTQLPNYKASSLTSKPNVRTSTFIKKIQPLCLGSWVTLEANDRVVLIYTNM